jgi:hypothetical protein
MTRYWARKATPIATPGGLIEAFEGKDPSWCVTGVQWHPKNEGDISLDMQLIEAFIEAAARPRLRKSAEARIARLTQSRLRSYPEDVALEAAPSGCVLG